MSAFYTNTIILFFLLTGNSFALTLTGEGYGESEKEAKKQALASLSESIYVEVKSEFQSAKSSDGDNEAQQFVTTRSDLPILGVSFNVFPKQNEYFCNAILTADKSLRLYKKKLISLQSDIQSQYADIEENQPSPNRNPKRLRRHERLTKLLSMMDQFDKYNTVAMMLGDNLNIMPVVSKAKIKDLLLSIESLAPSLDTAASILSKQINKDRIYIYPATPTGSHEVTAFGRLLKDKLATKLNLEKNAENAEYIFKGKYEILKDSIHVTYHLLDGNEDTIATRIVNIAPSAYETLAYKPKTINFDQLLHQGYVVSNDFKVNLNTNIGRENLLFTEGEEVELFVKLNKAGYYYIVSYVKNDTEDYSYLLELSESNTKRRFIQFVNADDANRWISLGKFEVSAPYGVESLQVIASNRDLIDNLPNADFDTQTGLYIASKGNPEQVMIRTRGLKPKKKKGTIKVDSAETVLMMTTMHK